MDKYPERIRVSRPEKLDLESLNTFIDAHQLNIPYYSPYVGLLNRELSLNIEDLFNKLIINKRGGCYFETNGLFMKFIKDLGFDTHSIPCKLMQTPECSLAISDIGYDPVDFLPPNYMYSVEQNALFRDKAWVNIRTQDGSVSLKGRKLTVV